jgi:DNA-binding MarR family transcriptional regulator
VRQPHQVHRRLLGLYLSNAGESVVEEAEPIVAEIERQMVALLTEDEQANLARMLQLCSASLR